MTRAVALLWLLATVARAEEGAIEKWQTPEGELYFGSRPPAGSTRLGTVEPLGTSGREDVGVPEVNAEAAAEDRAARDGADIHRRRAAEREAEREREAVLADAVHIVTVASARGHLTWQVAGTVRNDATETVHGVEVGSQGTWVATEPSTLAPGQEGSFRLVVERRDDAYDSLPPPRVRWSKP